MVSDGTQLPYRTSSFDAVISVAVVHHFSTVERRIQAIQEMIRITKPGGLILVCCWAFEQKDKKGEQRYKEQDVFVPWNLQKQYKRVDSDQNTNVYDRYYHMFKENELEDLVLQCEDVNKIEQQAYESDNWIVVFSKK
jgi:tRNA (uracil-5-)-methyltransferase TRM9